MNTYFMFRLYCLSHEHLLCDFRLISFPIIADNIFFNPEGGGDIANFGDMAAGIY